LRVGDFGGNGDLAWRKLVPSLFSLHIDKSLPEKMAIIAVDRPDIDDATLRKRLRVGVKKFARAGSRKIGETSKRTSAIAAAISRTRRPTSNSHVGSRNSTKIGTPK
jgi:glucose-6-phosphate 1-dehydrogenase